MDSNPQEQIEKEYPRRHHEKLKKKFTALKLVFLLSSILIILSITLWPIIKDGPEKIFFDTGKEQKEPVNSLEGTLVGIDFFGSYTRYQIQLTDGTFFKLSLHHRKPKQHKHFIGDSVRVLFPISDVFQIHEN